MNVLLQGTPLMAQSLGGAFAIDMGIQLVGWAFSAALKTEKYYDLCGSLAFASTAALTFANSGMLPRQVLATAMAGRLRGRGVFIARAPCVWWYRR
jgi:hypothetical protein